MKTNLYNLRQEELGGFLSSLGLAVGHKRPIFHALYRHRVKDLTTLGDHLPANCPASVVECLLERAYIPQPIEHQRVDSSDGFTRKFLLATHPDHPEKTAAIETVRMDYHQRHTACVSSQAGCAMGCVFCATGQMGFKRHLETAEIVSQVLHVIEDLAEKGARLTNIVFMGMGEPLHNFAKVMRALDIITDPHGIGLAPSHISVSTVGLPRRIRELAEHPLPVGLAVSLHGATNEAREALVPVAKTYSLDAVLDACRYYTTRSGRRIFFEWALIDQQNDTPEQAEALAQRLEGIPCVLNLIPLNPTEGYGGEASDPARMEAFRAILRGHGVRTTVRLRRGIDVGAGCGQLANADG